MPITLTAEQQQKLLELLQRELRGAAESALADGMTPAALAEFLDGRRIALAPPAVPTGPVDDDRSAAEDDLQHRGDDPGEPGRVAQ